ncbi:head maturation protease, ClpP-related [Rugamonas rubra]|uniref:ATP-dependent Clp protease proteolytic subunit n=1 Tax=Rugamonas rubra TaxID=758825 RepID=A0A1I4SH66_9BURK|nr:head maturation protease, ClpP-related [Rugamonas rubra]SFM63807.1 ATP-dependent protease ClpP, protease subunit [Rugamonas rubra]
MKKLVQLIRNNADRAPAKIRSEAEPETLFLYDVIDPYWGVGAAEFNKELAGMSGKKVTLRVNSPGGDVFDGRAMAAAIAAHGNVHAVIEGLAASAATYVTAACASVDIARGSFYMIHKAWTMAYGNDDDLIQTAALLGKIDQSIVADYARKTGKSNDEIVAWMKAETWFTADEALANGFVDSISETAKVENKWDLTAYNNAPKITAKEDDPTHWEAVRQRNANRLRLHEFG